MCGKNAALLAILLLLAPMLLAQDSLKQLARQMQPQVQRLRGLKFVNPPAIEIKSPQTLKFLVRRRFAEEYPPAKLVARETALKKLGLIPEALNLRLAWQQLLAGDSQGFYDPKARKLYLADAEPKQTGPRILRYTLKLMQLKFGQITMVHHLTLCLLGQHYPVMALPIDIIDNDDQILALQALWHGDALDTMMTYLLQKLGLDPHNLDTGNDFLQQLPLTGLGSHGFLRAAPYFRERLSFAPLRGWHFIKEVRQYRGNEYLNFAYRQSLPYSSEQILHPRKFFGKRDNPTAISWSTDLRPLFGKGWREVYSNTIGELLTGVMLAQKMPLAQARTNARGWDGDRYMVLQNSGYTALVYYSTWDNPAYARRFFNAYRQVLSAKYKGLALYNYTEDRKTPQLVGRLAGQSFYLGLRDRSVLAIESAPPPALLQLIAAAWDVQMREVTGDFTRVVMQLCRLRYGFSLELPPDWQLQWLGQKKLAIACQHRKLPLALKIAWLPRQLSLAQLAALLAKAYETRVAGLLWLKKQPCKLGEHSVYVLRYRSKSAAKIHHEVLIPGTLRYYLLSAEYPQSLSAQGDQELAKIVTAFRSH